MATKHTDQDVERLTRGSFRSIYPWNEWTDGSWWEARKDEDFVTPVLSFRSTLYTYASRYDLTVETRRVGDSMFFKFQDPAAENARRLREVGMSVGQLIEVVGGEVMRKQGAQQERAARWVYKKIAEGVERGGLARAAASKNRRWVPDGIRVALERNWIAEAEDGALILGSPPPADTE